MGNFPIVFSAKEEEFLAEDCWCISYIPLAIQNGPGKTV